MSEQDFSNVLDLSGADTTGFDPVDGGRYDAEVWEMEWQKTKPDATGAYGPNWPYINVQFKIEGRVNKESVGDRRVFAKFFPKAPDGYDPKKAAKSQGTFVNFLVALGYKEEDIKTASFQLPDFESLKAKPLVIVVSKDPNKDDQGNLVGYFNNVNGFKPAGSAAESSSVSALL